MPPAAIDTSVVITTCSRASSLSALLHSILPQIEAAPFAVELVVVNDGSTDETAGMLEALAATSRVEMRILAGECRGVAAARNLGLQAARGRWIVTCDDDQIAVSGWLEALHQAAECSDADVVGGPLTLHLPEPFQVGDYGPRARRLLGYSEPAGGVRAYAQGRGPATNNALMRAELVRSLGGFDAQFTEGGEDADLFQRVVQAGGTIVYQPAAVMIHMLTERRLTKDGLRWAANRVGAGEARVRWHTGGRAALILHSLVRISVLLVRDLPQLAVHQARGDSRATTDVLCSLWYTAGLLRAAPALVRGGTPQTSAFLRQMDFRSRNGERSGQDVRRTQAKPT